MVTLEVGDHNKLGAKGHFKMRLKQDYQLIEGRYLGYGMVA